MITKLPKTITQTIWKNAKKIKYKITIFIMIMITDFKLNYQKIAMKSPQIV